MKNKNGFTLVELLVTITLMLTLLGLAIASYINVSNSKKREAWQMVKSQIETAAAEYFTSNEYWFDGLGSGAKGEITVGALVKEDYLNRVVNPVSGDLVDECSYAVVTKKANGSYDAKYHEEVSESCGSLKQNVVVIEPGAPEIDPDIDCTLGNDMWCISNATIDLDLKTHGVPIKEINLEDSGSLCDNPESDAREINCKNEGKTDIFVTVINNANKIVKATVGELKVDKTAPKIDDVLLKSAEAEGKYNSNKVLGSFKITDTTSGIGTVTSNVPNKNGETDWFLNGDNRWEIKDYTGYAADSLDGSKITLKITAYDVAGNKSVKEDDEEYVVYHECGDGNKKLETSTCSNNGYITKKTTDILTGIFCEPNVKEDCSVDKIMLALNYNAGNAESNPGMKNPGPMASNGKGRIFNSSKGTKDYSVDLNNMSNIVIGWNNGTSTLTGNANTYCNNQDVKNCNATDAGYTANVCMNVSDFDRRFRFWVLWDDGSKSSVQYVNISAGKTSSTNTFFKNRNTSLSVTISEDLSKKVYRYGCSEEKGQYNPRTCGKSSGSNPDVTIHSYNLKADKKTSNSVTLYTSYFVDCNY